MRTTGKGMALILAAVLAMSGCSASTTPTQDDGATPESVHYTAGTYTGTSEGRGEPITVEVTVSEDAITNIEVVDHQETPGISDLPLSEIPAEIVEYQSLNIDNITGATLTTNGLVRAVSDALEQAGGDVEALSEVAIQREAALAEDLTTMPGSPSMDRRSRKWQRSWTWIRLCYGLPMIVIR